MDRWNYTRVGTHKLVESKDFPSPIGIVCKGRIKIFREEDIQDYEKTQSWLFDESQKIQRQKIYACLQLAKEKDSEVTRHSLKFLIMAS